MHHALHLGKPRAADLKASPLPPAPFWLVAVWVVAGVAKVGIMFIDAKIVRHSRNAVVNIIEKDSK